VGIAHAQNVQVKYRENRDQWHTHICVSIVNNGVSCLYE
jgi:hypothetical protein